MPRGTNFTDAAALQQRLWTPRLLPPTVLALWLDGADLSTITLNGSNVSQWNDKSGNSRHFAQATSGFQPPYSQLDGSVQWNKTGPRFLTNTVPFGTAELVAGRGLTFFEIQKMRGAPSLSEGVWWEGNSGNTTPFFRMQASTTATAGRLGAGHRNDANTLAQPSITNTPVYIDTEIHLSIWTIIGGAEKGYKDDDPNTVTNGVNAFSGATTVDTSMLGASTINTPSGTNHNVYEFIIIYGIDDRLRNIVAGYLDYKWSARNLTQIGLPAAHPYATRPPEIGV